MSDTVGSITDLRSTLPPLEQVQGLTVADLSSATEAVYARGWEQAMAAAQERLDETIRIGEEIHRAALREATDAARREGQAAARERVSRDLRGVDEFSNDDRVAYDAPVRKAARLLKLLDDITDNLPASISKQLRGGLREADTLALAVSNAIDKHAGAGR